MKVDYYKTSEEFSKSERFTNWKKDFQQTDLWTQLEDEYDYILDWFDGRFPLELSTFALPRKLITSKFTSLIGFYFIENYLNKEEQIVDVGCGINYWKNYYDVHGVDPFRFSHAVNEYEVDITSAAGGKIGVSDKSSVWLSVNRDLSKVTTSLENDIKNQVSYYERNKGKFKNIMSQCSLHFDSDIGKVLKDFYGLLGSNGKGFASLNLQRLFEIDGSTSLTRQLNKLREIEDIIQEVIVIQTPNNNSLDGNLHIVFKETA